MRRLVGLLLILACTAVMIGPVYAAGRVAAGQAHPAAGSGMAIPVPTRRPASQAKARMPIPRPPASQLFVWPMFRHDLFHVGRTIFPATGTGTLFRKVPAGNRVDSSPVVASDGTIYVGSFDGNLYAFNRDGTIKPHFPCPISSSSARPLIFNAPTLGPDGTIYVGSDDGSLYAVSSTCAPKWSFSVNPDSPNQTLGGYVETAPAVGQDGTIYFGAGFFPVGQDTPTGSFYAISPTGGPRWKFPTGGPVDSSPAIGPDGTIYFGSDDQHIYALTSLGSVAWSFPTIGAVRSSPALSGDGTVYVGTASGFLCAIRADGSGSKWCNPVVTTPPVPNVYSSPAIGADGTIYVGTGTNQVDAFNPDGTMKWTFPTAIGSPIYSSPAVSANGTIFIGSGHVPDPAPPTPPNPILDGDRVVRALSPDGKLLWTYSAVGVVLSSPAIGADGTIYVGAEDGFLYAIH